jgi:exodeoxyribonuclease V gamma subunit
MFILHSSNKTENLLAHLTAVLTNQPLSSPFASEVFLIQSQGMERWLSQQLAEELKVWGNYQFLFPGRFFSSLAENLDSHLSDAAFDRHVMVWRFEAALRRLDGTEFAPLKNYIQGVNSELKRFQLAQQLSSVFDQYQMMRPDMLALWQQDELLYGGETELWQRSLWQKITTDTGQQHRGSLWLQLVEKLNTAKPGYYQDRLPERISVFGINSLPPLFLGYLQALSRHCDVHFFLLNPAQVFWGDLPGRKLRAQLEDFEGHPLLVALGQQGREFQQMLLDQLQFELELDSFEENEAFSLLQHIQNDLLSNQLTLPVIPVDHSISIHACHSRLREVQVIKNQLLAALEQDHALQLRDIVVMAPDIQVYAPFISATFADIQHAIADRSLRLSNELLDVFINFLHLSQSRFGWRTVLDILEQPLIAENFDLTAVDLELVRFWIDDTRVRWGRDAAHKQALQLPPLAENTWQATLDRLLMGYAMGDDRTFVDGILPYRHIEGSSAQTLGGLYDFLQLLFRYAESLATARSLQQWSELLLCCADQLLADSESAQRRQLNELLLELGQHYAAVHDEPVTLQVIIQWLEGMVSESKSSTGFLRGQLTFCSMLPMRSIPFKVIVLLGMNEGEFPKIDRHPTFDLLGRNFRMGDRSRRADDRYQFLEILLSARQQLIISYIGRSIKDNAEIPPSIIVSELLDILQGSYQLTDPIIRHPLHAFSSQYFNDQQPQLFSYEALDYAIATHLSEAKIEPQPWWQGSIDSNAMEVIDLADLLAFYRHPQKYFMQRQLGVRSNGLVTEVDEREPFMVEGLDNYALQQEWIAAELNDTTLSLPMLRAQGRWPPGPQGDLAFVAQEKVMQEFAEQIRQQGMGDKLEDISLDLTIGPYRLSGKLSHCYQQGALLYRYSKVKGKDFFQAWIEHLLLNQQVSQSTVLLSKEYSLMFNPEMCLEQDLQTLLDIFVEGQRRPDAFFTEATFDYVMQAKKVAAGKSKTDPLQFAVEKMQRTIAQPYELELRRLFNSSEVFVQVFDQAFINRCETLILPIWESVHGD